MSNKIKQQQYLQYFEELKSRPTVEDQHLNSRVLIVDGL